MYGGGSQVDTEILSIKNWISCKSNAGADTHEVVDMHHVMGLYQESGPAVHHSAKPEKVGHSSSSKSFVWKYRSELELCIAAIIIFIPSFSKTNEILNFSLLQVIFLHYTLIIIYQINITFASWTLKLLKLMDFLATGLTKLKEISCSLSEKNQLKL